MNKAEELKMRIEITNQNEMSGAQRRSEQNWIAAKNAQMPKWTRKEIISTVLVFGGLLVYTIVNIVSWFY